MNSQWSLNGAGDQPGADWVLGGRYRLLSPVGAGGMAVVWQAYDSVLARTVAVKVLAAHYADDPQSRDRIRQEARAAAGLSHPNIAQVHDYGEADVRGRVVPYVVMELIRGGTLHQRLSDGPVLPRQSMRICAEVAAALAAAHAEGLAHRDIKPANVMLAPTGAKVVDFGIAAAIQPPGSGAGDFEVIGTPAYLAPERLLHDAVEPASDVYALGVLLYRLLTGHSPWTSETTTQMLTAHIYLEPAPLIPMYQVPDYVTTLCNRCLSKDPAQRPSAREAAALLAHGAGLPIVTDQAAAVPAGTTADDPVPVLIRSPGSADQPDGARHADLPPADSRSSSDDGKDAEAVAEPIRALDEAAKPGTAKLNRVMFALAVAALIVAGTAALWLLPRPADRPAAWGPTPAASDHQPAPGATPSGSTGKKPPGVSTAPAGSGPGLIAGTGRATTDPVTAATAPGGPGAPAVTAPGVTTPATSTAEPTATRTDPPAEPQQRTLSSSAGSIEATCPATDTAQILSWSAVKPYKLAQWDKAAGSSPAVSFKHGNTQVTMTVTCDGGVPSAATS